MRLQADYSYHPHKTKNKINLHSLGTESLFRFSKDFSFYEPKISQPKEFVPILFSAKIHSSSHISSSHIISKIPVLGLARGLGFLWIPRAVPVSSLICCIELKSIVYTRPRVDKLISSSPFWWAVCRARQPHPISVRDIQIYTHT